MDERRLEVKIGVLALAAIAGVLALLLLTDELRLTRGTELTVDLAHSGSVAKGAPVKLAGVRVGRVEAVRLLPERIDAEGRALPVQLRLEVDAPIFEALTSATVATIATQGPLGEPYVALDPAPGKGKKLEQGQALRGQDPVRLEVVLQRASSLLESFGAEGGGGEILSAVESIGRLAARVDSLLAGNEAEAKTVVEELSRTLTDVRAVASRLRALLEPGGDASRLLGDGAAISAALRKSVPGMSEDAARALAGLERLTGSLDAQDGERLKSTLARVAAASASLESLASRGERLLVRIEAGEGTLGLLQKDPTLYLELRELVTDLRKHPWKVLWKD